MMNKKLIIFIGLLIVLLAINVIFSMHVYKTKQTSVVKTVETVEINPYDLHCLSQNIYHEARGQSYLGQLAVGFVTLNRVKDSRFPSTICEVVFQAKKTPNGKIIKNECQFSWFCDSKSDMINDVKTFVEIHKISHLLLTNPPLDVTHGATFYHSVRVKPSWAKQKDKTVRIDDHIFYKWKE